MEAHEKSQVGNKSFSFWKKICGNLSRMDQLNPVLVFWVVGLLWRIENMITEQGWRNVQSQLN